jgi:hypothetical protein
VCAIGASTVWQASAGGGVDRLSHNNPLKPETSFLVRNSDVNPCVQHHHPDVGENSQPLESHFDRYTPSVLAFEDQKSATGFAGEHGGQVVKFSDFATEFQR